MTHNDIHDMKTDAQKEKAKAQIDQAEAKLRETTADVKGHIANAADDVQDKFNTAVTAVKNHTN